MRSRCARSGTPSRTCGRRARPSAFFVPPPANDGSDTTRGEPAVSQRRVVVTGMGLVSPVGLDTQSSWQCMLTGKSGGGLVTAFEATEDFPCRIGCEVKGFDPLQYMDKRDAKRFDRVSQFAIAASAQAMASAGFGESLGGVAPERFGVIIGSGIGGIAT